MIRSTLVVLLSLALAEALSAQARSVVCESRNGSYKRCDVGDVSRAWIERRISDTECVANRTWGFDDRGIWVDEGCRAEFSYLVRSSNSDDDDDRRGDSMIRCESKNGRRTHCPADTSRGVFLERQLSILDCDRDVSWGYDRRGVWVDAGCRAEFRLGRMGGNPRRDNRSKRDRDTIRCESLDGRRNDCRIDTRGGVTIVRQISKTECVLDRNWGWNRNGIWVTDGCRAEFMVGQRSQSWGSPTRTQTLSCESRNGQREYCRIEGRVRSVRVFRQKSSTDCVQGETWGYDRNGVWVDDGCRAEFQVTTEE